MKGEFYKMDFRAWNTGTVDLSLEQEAAYLRLCHAMYDAQGPVPSSARFLMSIFRCGNSKAAGLVRQLMKAGKIQRTPNGMLINRRVTTELTNRERLSDVRRAAGERGGKGRRSAEEADQSDPRVPIECGSSDPRVTPECGSSDPQVPTSNPLKNNDTPKAIASTLRSRGDKRRGDSPKAPKGAEPTGFAEFWTACWKRQGDNSRPKAMRAYAKAIAAGEAPEALRQAAQAYGAELRVLGKLGTEYAPMVSSWLNGAGYERFIRGDSAQPGGAPPDPASRLTGITDEAWRDRVRLWKTRGGHWPWQQITEPPDDPRTRVPAHVLAEFGIVHGTGSGSVTPLRRVS